MSDIDTGEIIPQSLDLDQSTIITIWVLSFFVIIFFALVATFLSYRHSKQNPEQAEQLEFFLTARNSQPTLRVAWSFIAGALGAWVLAGPAGYAVLTGYIGLITYSLASGFPIFLLALVGDRVQKKLPTVLGFCHYVKYRFGLIPQIYVVLIMLLNMGVALTAEYTAVGDLFEKVLGLSRVPIVVTVGLVTMAYTAYGGLYISILTDMGQAIFASALMVLLSVYVAITFRPDLPELPPSLGPNLTGYSSIAVMPISLFCATIYSEAPWQRVWASENPKALRNGAALASVVISLFVFAFGLFGFLAAWAGYPTDDPNVLVFSLLAHGEAIAPSWIIVVVVILVVTMNESAVDSMQNALVDTVSTMVLRGRSVTWARVAVVVINVPIIIVSLQNYPVINLFLIGNMVTSTSALPMLLGLWDNGYGLITGPAALFGCLFSLVSVMVYGYLEKGDFGAGLNYVFFESYDYPSFIIAITFSLLGVFLWVTVAKLLSAIGLPQYQIPGFIPEYLEVSSDDEAFLEPVQIRSTESSPRSKNFS